MIFLRIYIEFQSLQLEITKRSLKHYSSESQSIQTTPWIFLNFNPRFLAGKQEQSRAGGAVSGEQGRRRGGPEGEKREGLMGYLWRVLGLADADGGGGSTEQSGRRRTHAATVVLRRLWRWE